MNRHFRKTSQLVAPASRPAREGVYEIYPGYPLGPGEIQTGFAALTRTLAGHRRIVLDGMGGVLWPDLCERLRSALGEIGRRFAWLSIDEAIRPVEEIERLVAPYLGGDDPLFGTRASLRLRDFFSDDLLRELTGEFHTADSAVVHGTGAALVAEPGDLVVYLDVPKNEIQFRSRAGSIANLGARVAFDPKGMYKRFYFVDWPVLRAHLAGLLPRIDLVVDVQRPEEPTLMTGDDLRAGLETASRTWCRVRPWFEPGPWGGQWMKRRFPGLSPEAPNLAWSFELIAPENGLAFESGGLLLEVAFDFLMAQNSGNVLGDFAARFAPEFPIRFDYLDTVGGGNLSLQCHPRPEYALRHFGERFTQDETYYITDCAADATVYLGFREDIDRAEFEQALRASHRDGTPLDVDRYVRALRAKKHGLYLIPNGTVHCSGRDNLVLEISATPYIFTFKMYDWLRLDLDGRPRPLNIDRALENLDFSRRGDRIEAELLSRPRPIARGEGWDLVHLPTHPEHFYDVHRIELRSGTIELPTEASPQVLNLVEGDSVLLEVPGTAPRRFAFGETFLVPAAARTYRLRDDQGGGLKVIRAFLKPEARRATQA